MCPNGPDPSVTSKLLKTLREMSKSALQDLIDSLGYELTLKCVLDHNEVVTPVDLTSCVKAVDSLVVRASDSVPDGLGSMPPNTLRVHTEYVLVKSLGSKTCGLNHEHIGLENISLPFSSMQKITEVK
ncbi:hypothetical protein TNCV_2516581 [Trichonephila clavipes]|nr:hypothetical protein TNCV_2516581 [Trichonephila clavipes]